MNRVKVALIGFLEKLIGLMFMVIAGVTLTQVFCRYGLGFSLTWSHELVVLLLIWVVWLAMPLGLDRGQHLAVTIILDNVRPSLQKLLLRVHWLLGLFFMGLIFWLSFPVIDAFEGMNLLTLPIPTNARYYAATAGSLLSIFVLIAGLFRPKEGS